MSELYPKFNPPEFEKYGTFDPFLTEEQLSKVSEVSQRVNSQLDWVAQSLGWNGPNYWNNLVSSVEQKRNLLVGSFGFYNGNVIPEVLSVLKEENKVVVKGEYNFVSGKYIRLGEEKYLIVSVENSENESTLTLEDVPDKFIEDFESGLQLKVTVESLIPSPFLRPTVKTSGDCEFHVKVVQEGKDQIITLFPGFDIQEKFPFLLRTLYVGSRYWFDQPIILRADTETEEEQNPVLPKYDFEKEKWWVEVPAGFEVDNLGLSGLLTLGEASVPVRVKQWEDPSDWLTEDNIDNFSGVWGNKGGRLPLHFAFDALSLHGFDEKLSVRLEAFEREIPFDTLLNFVYLQRVSISPGPPNFRERQVWWDPDSGAFSFYTSGAINCGPWVETQYPTYIGNSSIVDFVFPDVGSFISGNSIVQTGDLVQIVDFSGLGPSSGVQGVTQIIPGTGAIKVYKPSGGNFWKIEEVILQNEEEFSDNCQSLPQNTRVILIDSSGLTPETPQYKVANLNFEVTEAYRLLLMKAGDGRWYISPPSNLKYIGNTRLFESFQNLSTPVEGEMNWDFDEANPDIRDARVFYYNRWEQEPPSGEWVLKGDWVSVKEDSVYSPSPIPEVLDFGVVKVFCDGYPVAQGVPYLTYDFSFKFEVNEETGTFVFTYNPITYSGSVNLPKITLSDSLTGVFTFDISKTVFSGLRYYMSPNVEDSETLLRVWKTEPLQVSDSLDEVNSLRYLNPLRADINQGPSDPNWSRYFIRVPPAYGRNEVEWQKISLICQNFCYWGSSLYPEEMSFNPVSPEPAIYERVSLYGKDPNDNVFIYSEPYWYSDVLFSKFVEEDFENSNIVPGYDKPFDDFLEAEITDYSPLHERGVDFSSNPGQGFGDWDGNYFTSSECVSLTGHLVNDILSEVLQPASPPVWDSSIYKYPIHNRSSDTTGRVDANNYKIGYAFFAADLSSAEEAVFDLGKGTT